MYTGNGSEVATNKALAAKDLIWKPKPKSIWDFWITPPYEPVIYKVSSEKTGEFVIELDSEVIGTLPSPLTEIYNSIVRSKYILDLEDDWDDEGSPSYEKTTLISAIKFLINLSTLALEKLDEIIPTPELLHSSEGSIDILWQNDEFRLLLNISADSSYATFYGDSYGEENSIRGKFDLNTANYGIMLSLIST